MKKHKSVFKFIVIFSIICNIFSVNAVNAESKFCENHHTFSDYKLIKQPTYLEDGLKERHCLNCDYKEETPVKKLKRTAISSCKITIESKAQYTGKAIKQNVKVTYKDEKLTKNKDYTLEYENNKSIGIATVTVTGINAYKGSVVKKFKITPEVPKIAKLYSPRFVKVKISYKKINKADGYHIKYSQNKNLKNAEIISTKELSKSIIGLLSGEKYYFAVCSYKKVDGKNIYSEYSKAKSVKVKKTAHKQSKKNVICLTFDDGPSANVTPKILKALKKNGIKATFFIVNYNEETKPIVKQIIDDGHTLGVHCYSHEYGQIYKSEETFMKYFNKLKNKIKKDFDYDIKVMRFPGGSSNTVSRSYCSGVMTKLTKRMNKLKIRYFDWNVTNADAESTYVTVPHMKETYKSGLVKGRTNVVLMHDSAAKTNTAAILQELIDYSYNNGYVFSAITNKTPQIKHPVAN